MSGNDGLFLGRSRDAGEPLFLDPDHLTTHAVCLGMTGSGKTGLGIVALEELARRRVPMLVIDLKGDMVNLLLGFPNLAASDFGPWLPADVVAGRDRTTVAEEQAALWRKGLAGSGLGTAEMLEVRQGVDWQLLTPGVASAAPLDILPTLSMPPGADFEGDPDGIRDRVNGLVSALLSLIGRGGDPLTDPDHVLLASIILEHWRRGDALDLVRLLGSVADPPMTNLGALPLETFYPRDKRMKLVMQLNTLIASPAFAAWTTGEPLTMENLLGTPDSPRCTVLSVAHLDERQRLFVLALVFSELVGWMRDQPASAGLRALLYMDEVQGILPPHPANPPTKGPLLTLLKQGRAFGVGAWLATQNPVDLDYKALGNAGVKVVGRLVTDRDRERALEGLEADYIEGVDADALVAGLDKREFVLYDVRAEPRVRVFSSRWAMSYLRGPVTLAEMSPLVEKSTPQRTSTDAPTPQPVDSAGATSPPLFASGVSQRFAARGSGMAVPQLRVGCRLTLERKTLGLYRTQEEIWSFPVAADGGLDLESGETLDAEGEIDDRPPADMRFPDAVAGEFDAALAKIERSFVVWRARRPVAILANPALKIAADAGEDREAFLERCLEAADEADDARQERVRRRFEKKMQSLKKRLEREKDELDRDQVQLESRQAEEKLGVVEGLFSVLLGSRSLRSAAGKAATKARSAASKRRMRQRAEASVVESEREIDRLTDELEDLAVEMQDEIDSIAAESEVKAEGIEEVPVKAKQADIAVLRHEVVWT